MLKELISLVGISIAIFYGGGQVPEANYVLGSIIRTLYTIPNVVLYGVRKSFMGLACLSCYELLTTEKAIEIQSQIGTYFETCRKFEPYDKKNFGQILKNLRKYNIHFLIVPGGDGSAVAIQKFRDACRQAGYPIFILWFPSTIDGINGSSTMGFEAAVQESVRRVKAMAVNAFATWDNGFCGPRVAVVEIQGRNRNDISVMVIKKLESDGYIGRYKISDIKIIFLATGSKWSFVDLIYKIKSSKKPVLIIASEGTIPEEKAWFNAIAGQKIGEKIGNLINSTGTKKANVDIVGYLSQTNDHISEQSKKTIDEWTEFAVQTLKNFDFQEDFYAMGIIKNDNGFKAVPIEFITEQNSSDKPLKLSKEDQKQLKQYMM